MKLTKSKNLLKNIFLLCSLMIFSLILSGNVMAAPDAPFDVYISTPGNETDNSISNVSVFQKIIFEFPKASGTLTVDKAQISISPAIASGFDAGAEGNKLIISPKDAFAYNTQYTVKLNAGAITGLTGAIEIKFKTEYDFAALIAGGIDDLLKIKSPRELNFFVHQYISTVDIYNNVDTTAKKVITSIDISKNDAVSSMTVAIGPESGTMGEARTASLRNTGKAIVFNAGFQPATLVPDGATADRWKAVITALDNMGRPLQTKPIIFDRLIEGKKSYTSADLTNKGKPYILQDLLDKDKAKFSEIINAIINAKVTVRTMIALDGVTLDLATKQLKGTTASMEYSYDAKSGDTGSWTRCAASATDINPGSSAKQILIREWGTTNNYRIISMDAQPAAPKITIDYITEMTNETIPTNMEYDDNEAFSSPVTGTGEKVALTPDVTSKNIYFRVKATTTMPSGKALKLVVPARPAAPSVSINYGGLVYNDSNDAIKVRTKEKITSALEYYYTTDGVNFTGPIAGTGAEAELEFKTTYHFRAKATAKSFKGTPKEISVPESNTTAAPTIGIDYANEKTNGIVPNNVEYAEDVLFTKNKKIGAGVAVVLTPGKDLYFRVKAGTNPFPGKLTKLVVKDRQAEPTIGPKPAVGAPAIDIIVDYAAQTINIPATIEYADDKEFTKNRKDGTGNPEDMTPGEKEKIIYFRKKPTPTEFKGKYFEYKIPVRPAAPVYTIDYAKETTKEKVPSTVEYADDNGFTKNKKDGAGAAVPMTPGTEEKKMYFQVKSTATSFAGKVFELSIPAIPVIPQYTIDYANEKTKETLGTNIEYTIVDDVLKTSIIKAGTNAAITIEPGDSEKTYYFRVKATDSSFKNTEYKSLKVPKRGAAPPEDSPFYKIDYIFSRTADNITSDIEYTDDKDFKINKKVGTGTYVALTPGKNLYFRYKATDTAFASKALELEVPKRESAPSGDSYKIDFKEEKTTGTIPADVEYAEDKDFKTNLKNATGAAVDLTPGKNLYFRTKAKGTEGTVEGSFDSEYLERIVPKRPAKPEFTIYTYADSKKTTMQNVSPIYEYNKDGNEWEPGKKWKPGENKQVELAAGSTYLFRIIATDKMFHGEEQELKP